MLLVQAVERIVRFAFELARREKPQGKVTAVHKANIFEDHVRHVSWLSAREVAQNYPDIQFEEMIVDATCMKLVMTPEIFDVIVTTNLFGDIIF